LFRILISDGSLQISKDKDKKDPNSKAMLLAKADRSIDKGQWHTMLVEIEGGRVKVQTDHGLTVDASDPSLDVDKTGYRFVTRGASLLLDDVTVWEVAP